MVVGLHWEDFPEKDRSFFKKRRFLAKQSKENAAPLWTTCAKQNVSMRVKPGVRYASPSKYAIFEKPNGESTSSVRVGSLAFLTYVEQNIASINTGSVFVLIYEFQDEFGLTKFWTCAVDEFGVVQYDHVTNSATSVVVEAQSFISFKTHVFALNCNTFDVDDINTAGEHPITSSYIDMNDWLKFIDKNSDKKRLKPQSSTTDVGAKKAVLIATVFATIASAYIASGYLSQREAISQFSDKNSLPTTSKMELFQSQKKTKLGAKMWDDKTFNMHVKSEFIAVEASNQSSPTEILNAIYVLSDTIPLYLNEFRFSKIAYVNGEIQVYFIREPESSTVYHFLDKSIVALNDRMDIKLVPSDLKDEAKTRIYTAQIIKDRSPSVDADAIVDSYEKKYDQLVKLSSSIKGKYQDVAGLSAEFDQLTWTDIVVDRKPEKLLERLRKARSDIASMEKKLKAETAELKKITIPEIEGSKLVGQVVDFVTMMQIDDQYTWTYPTPLFTIPSKKDIESNIVKDNKKPAKGATKKVKPTKKQKQYAPVIESYLVEIFSNKEKDVETDQKVVSLGSLDLLRLKKLINKPFIHISDVQYDMMSHDWVVKIIFIRKRPEFETLMSASEGSTQ